MPALLAERMRDGRDSLREAVATFPARASGLLAPHDEAAQLALVHPARSRVRPVNGYRAPALEPTVDPGFLSALGSRASARVVPFGRLKAGNSQAWPPSAPVARPSAYQEKQRPTVSQYSPSMMQ